MNSKGIITKMAAIISSAISLFVVSVDYFVVAIFLQRCEKPNNNRRICRRHYGQYKKSPSNRLLPLKSE